MEEYKQCPECHSTDIKYDKEDCEIYCLKCHLVLAATIDYVGGEHIDLPWGKI